MSENKNYISSVRLPGDDNQYHIKDREAITANDYASPEKAGVIKTSNTIVVNEDGVANATNVVRYDYDQGLDPEEMEMARYNIEAASESEIVDAHVGFDGAQYDSIGNAIRNQGAKIELEPIGGENKLEDATWYGQNATIVENAGGVITVQNEGEITYWLDPVSPVEIVPHVGYYANGDFTTLLAEDEEEAGYLNDGCYNVASDVWGSASLNKADVQSGKTVPALVFNFNSVKYIGGIELSCRTAERYITSFEVQLHGTNGWHTVYTQAYNPFEATGTVQFAFEAEMCSALRVLVYDYNGTKPQVMEMLALEAKTTTPYEKIVIQSISTTGTAIGGTTVDNLINNDKYLNFQTSSLPCSFTLNLGEAQKVSRMKIIPYNTKDYAPKAIEIQVQTANGWTDVYEGVAFTAGQTAPCIIDFNDTYEATSVRLVVNSILSQYLVFNGIELYAQGEEIVQAQPAFGIYTPPLDASASERAQWFIGVHVNSTKHYFEDGSYDVPYLSVDDTKSTWIISKSLTEDSMDIYATEEAAVIPMVILTIGYSNPLYAVNKTATFSNIVLVNLTETYGAGNEPSAKEYYDMMKATNGYSHRLVISSARGTETLYVKDNELGVGLPGKTAYQYARNGGYAGTEEEFASQLAISASSTNSEISEWMILGEGELTEPVSMITVSRNLASEEFSVAKARVELIAKSDAENDDIYIQLSDEDAYQVANGLAAGTDADTWMEFDYNQNHLLPTWCGQSCGETSKVSRYVRGAYAPITSVVIGTKNDTHFGIGTKYRVYYK